MHAYMHAWNGMASTWLAGVPRRRLPQVVGNCDGGMLSPTRWMLGWKQLLKERPFRGIRVVFCPAFCYFT
jgi:hypothetical protein